MRALKRASVLRRAERSFASGVRRGGPLRALERSDVLARPEVMAARTLVAGSRRKARVCSRAGVLRIEEGSWLSVIRIEIYGGMS